MIKLTPEQRLVQDEARKFASTELAPIAEELDTKASFPQTIIKKLANLGFLGIVVPEKYGGAEFDLLSYCLLIEEISKVCPSVAAILIANNALVAYPLLKYGTEEQKNKWLTKLARGEIIGAFALTEEYGEIKTTAKVENGGYVISGQKNFVVNAEVAELFIVCASIENSRVRGPDLPTDGIVPFLVERKSPPGRPAKAGDRAGDLEINKEDSIGMKASGICGLKLHQVKANILGNSEINDSREMGLINQAPTKDTEIIEDTLSFAGLGIGALSIGIGQTALEEAIKYSKQRKQFGQFICEFPLVQEMLVDMKTKVTQAQLLVYSAASGNQDFHMAKLVATESAMFAGIKGIQVYGGYGYTKDYPVERFFRDANVAQVWCGSSSVQKSKIAKELLGV